MPWGGQASWLCILQRRPGGGTLLGCISLVLCMQPCCGFNICKAKPHKVSGGGQGGRQQGLEERRRASADPETEGGEGSARAALWCQLELAWSATVQLSGFCQGSGGPSSRQPKARLLPRAALCSKSTHAVSQSPTATGGRAAGRVTAC